MPLEDLDLEFEDEEELKKKRSGEAVNVDVDLEFGASPEPAQKGKAALSAQDKTQVIQAPTAAASEGGQVKKLDEVRAKIAKVQTGPPNPKPATDGSSALQLAPSQDSVNLAQLVQEIEDTKFEARVQVAVAQEKGEFMAEVLSDAKLLQHQVQQMLLRLNQKFPQAKPELVAIQKALADFLAKKRK